MKVAIIVAKDSNNGIGVNNTLPWHIPGDIKRFKEITTGYPIIMGRKTYESIGRPLPNRLNVVITSSSDLGNKDLILASGLDDALQLLGEMGKEKVFIIGGAGLITEAFEIANEFYLTQVHQEFETDVKLPELDFREWVVDKVSHHVGADITYSYLDYVRRT